jgi:hypothetical protein
MEPSTRLSLTSLPFVGEAQPSPWSGGEIWTKLMVGALVSASRREVRSVASEALGGANRRGSRICGDHRLVKDSGHSLRQNDLRRDKSSDTSRVKLVTVAVTSLRSLAVGAGTRPCRSHHAIQCQVAYALQRGRVPFPEYVPPFSLHQHTHLLEHIVRCEGAKTPTARPFPDQSPPCEDLPSCVEPGLA